MIVTKRTKETVKTLLQQVETTNLKIIAISGQNGSGKDLNAEIIKHAFEDAGIEVKILKFAEPIRDEIKRKLRLREEEIDSLKRTQEKFSGIVQNLATSEPLKFENLTLREILILIGQSTVKSDLNFFTNFVECKINTTENKRTVFIISDLRFAEEYEWLKKIGNYKILNVGTDLDELTKI